MMLPEGSVVIHGGCRGADETAGSCVETCGLKVVVFPADWNRHGKAAGMIRNRQMLTEGKPDVVFAFAENIDATKGTRGMVALARKAGVPVMVFEGSNEG